MGVKITRTCFPDEDLLEKSIMVVAEAHGNDLCQLYISCGIFILTINGIQEIELLRKLYILL